MHRRSCWNSQKSEKIHDLVKFVVPCAVVEAKFPIPPDKSIHLGSYNEVSNDYMYAVASQRWLRFIGEVDKGSTEATSIDTTTSLSIDTRGLSEQNEVCQNLFDGGTTTRSEKSRGKKRMNWKKRKMTKGSPQLSLIPHFSDGVRKSRACNRCFSQPFAKLRALLIAEMIDKGEESIKAFTKNLPLVDQFVPEMNVS
ncbi:hypothetical protein F2Q69_00021745 [Brassica cretica]|uniref:Uncharacterized protein n=1 Tax=Brassica cretica TaxID=69181 RepID=A0A8S9QAY1_BRACR|nr:hypothetical protein F2Q69_00021745 [Brassica cretica]